MEVDNVCVDKW